MVKRRLKRVLATVIVMTMVAGMNLTVFAEEGGSNANNSTGTVSGNAVEKEEPIDVSEMAQKAAEDKIRKIKSGNGDKDGLIKAMLSIVYKFPSFTFDYLFDQTMAQIQ